MKLRPRPNVLIHLKTTIFKQENDLNWQNNKKNTKKNKIKTAMMKNCTICSVSAPDFFAQRTLLKILLDSLKNSILPDLTEKNVSDNFRTHFPQIAQSPGST